jgi:ferritin-like metal-binding protein YciE
MPKLDSLEPLMIDELRDILDAEKQITRALPKMAKAAASEQLRAAFEEHLEQTNGQIERLNRVFEELGERARGKKCEAMQSIIEEGQQMLAEAGEGPTRDALLIAAAQKVEHYEIASYGTARTFAAQLGHGRAASLLEETLQEERSTDERLTGLAESYANPSAAGESEEEDRPRRSTAGARRGTSSAADRSRKKAAPARGGKRGR